MSATIQFRAKVEKVYNMDDTLAYECVRVPNIERKHCDMAAFRSHKKIGPYANSDLFAGIIRRSLKDILGTTSATVIRLDNVPAGVSVDTGGFLALVTIEVD